VGKILNSLGKWWGTKPLVLTRALILGAVFPASEDPERWPDDLDIFLKCMCLDNAGMWKRKIQTLPASLCYPLATAEEREVLFEGDDRWKRGADPERREALEKKTFFTLGHTEQREYCCRVEQIDGPPDESWEEITAYLNTSARTLPELVQELATRRHGGRLKVGDAFCGIGSIPFEAAALGCDVYASDLNPVACLLTWGALHIIGGPDAFREKVHQGQKRLYDEVDAWIIEQGIETSREGWRAEAYLYCIEMKVPEWDDWQIPICPSWIIAPKTKTWVELIPIETEKRFAFKVRSGGDGYAGAEKGTKQGPDIVCPKPLRDIFKREGRRDQMPSTIPYQQVIQNAGGLRPWEKSDFQPHPEDVLQERLYCIRWRTPDWVDSQGRTRRGDLIYREPQSHDLDMEQKVARLLSEVFDDWQSAGWIPNWRIEPGQKTDEPIRTRGWTYWHHLFTPRQLLMLGNYSMKLAELDASMAAALCIALGRSLNNNSRLCLWKPADGGGIGGGINTFYNQALNTVFNVTVRGWPYLKNHILPQHQGEICEGILTTHSCDARSTLATSHIWITDPPYADAVNYEELSEFFLTWYIPHLKAAFPDWYGDSMRARAIKGNDAPFRVAMADAYRRLAANMTDDGMQIVMFTHKSTDVWEDLALIMWSAELQIKQVWSVATETPGAGIRKGNYVQATYNMVLRKRKGNQVGYTEFITPQVNKRVREVITRMRESQIEGGLARCGYTDTDYLLAAQAAAAEVVTGYAAIDGVDLEGELRTPNKERGRSALRTLMENAKRTATDFLVPPAMHRAIKKTGAADAYAFWREFSQEEKFLLKGLEQEAMGVFKIGAFMDLGRAYGLSDYESLLGPTKANDTRTRLPEELPRPDAIRFDAVPAADRNLWRHSPLRHIYHGLSLLRTGATMDRAIKHLADTTDFWNIRSTRLIPILSYLREITARLSHWQIYQDHLEALQLAVEHWKG